MPSGAGAAASLHAWIERALVFVATLPAKKPATKKPAAKKPA